MNVPAPASGAPDPRGPPRAASPPSVCPLCCETDLSAAPSAAVTLAACRHRSCRACLARWVAREEASGRAGPPACPFCRAPIGEEDVVAILGRPFQPRVAAAPGGDGGDGAEVDELTRHWLDAHTVPCRGCGSRIEKSDGCDLIECLCGHRFCYACGAAGGECDCSPGHIFPNDEFALNDCGHVPDAPIRDGDGRVDLAACIRRTEVVRERERRRNERRNEESRRWRHSVGDLCVSDGRWLFAPAKTAGSIAMLTQQLRHESIHCDRAMKRSLLSAPANGTAWLFLRRGADVRAMKQFLARDRVLYCRHRRQRQRITEVSAPSIEMELNTVWLFLPQNAGFRILKGMPVARRRRMKRDVERAGAREDEAENLTPVDAVLRSGAWLFQAPTNERTRNHLDRLSKHCKAAGQKKGLSSFYWNDPDMLDDGCGQFVTYFGDPFGGAGCRRPGCSDCARRREEDAEQCLESIFLVFPRRDEQEQMRC